MRRCVREERTHHHQTKGLCVVGNMDSALGGYNWQNSQKETEQNYEMPKVKPPLGLRPKKFADAERFTEVCGAISRYYNDEIEIPIEWVEEYNQLVKSK